MGSWSDQQCDRDWMKADSMVFLSVFAFAYQSTTCGYTKDSVVAHLLM
jgi:hypothetical protein